MRSSATRDSTGTSLVADFERAALAVGVRVRTAAYAVLPALLSAYGVSSSDRNVGCSADLRRELGFPDPLAPMTRPNTWVSRARLGIASTGTVLVAERLADDRISALLCTRHVLV